MTLCSLDLERRISVMREEDKKKASKVANRLLGIRKNTTGMLTSPTGIWLTSCRINQLDG